MAVYVSGYGDMSFHVSASGSHDGKVQVIGTADGYVYYTSSVLKCNPENYNYLIANAETITENWDCNKYGLGTWLNDNLEKIYK